MLELFWMPIPFKRYQNTPGCNTDIDKKKSKSYDFAIEGKNLVVSYCATNYVTGNVVSTAQQWPKSANKKTDLHMPKPFQVYKGI